MDLPLAQHSRDLCASLTIQHGSGHNTAFLLLLWLHLCSLEVGEGKEGPCLTEGTVGFGAGHKDPRREIVLSAAFPKIKYLPKWSLRDFVLVSGLFQEGWVWERLFAST